MVIQDRLESSMFVSLSLHRRINTPFASLIDNNWSVNTIEHRYKALKRS